MSFSISPVSQPYGDNEYLAFKQPGQNTESDRYFFGQRIPSYGILDFGQMSSDSTKRIALADAGITSQILLRSVYAFVINTTDDRIKFRLFQGNNQLVELQVSSSMMPYQFPDGAIVDPSLSIEVEPNKNVSSLLIYWQPVHVLDYFQVP